MGGLMREARSLRVTIGLSVTVLVGATLSAPGQSINQLQDETATVHSRWTKFCGDANHPIGKDICITVSEARRATRQFVAGAAVIVRKNDGTITLSVSLPVALEAMRGVQAAVGHLPPLHNARISCTRNFCSAEFAVNADFVAEMKAAQSVEIQGAGSATLPLADFAAAFDGPPTVPKAFEESRPSR